MRIRRTAGAGGRTVGGGAHADHEYLVIDAMAERTNLVAGLLNTIRNS
ncbi:hypothetical protein [Streptomyces sp. NPDC005077]